jgi:hypothetical protein
MPDEQPETVADMPDATDLLVALATRAERLALILGPPRPWAGTPGVRLAPLALPSALASPGAGRDAALALGERALGIELEPVAPRWTYGPSARHAMDRAPALSAEAPFLCYERLDVGAEGASERPRRVTISVYLARARGIGAAGVVWLPLAALRAALGGLWLPAFRALEGVEFAPWSASAPDETLIFTPAAAGERQLLRACAKFGDAILISVP